MCGIAGIFAYRKSAPPVDEQKLSRIHKALPCNDPAQRQLDISYEG
jgi:hypothetical protein